MTKYLLRNLFIFYFLFFAFSILHAQAPPSYSSADIYQQVKKLHTLGSVLYIAAHPDDENTRLLAYLAKEKQYRTGYLSLTRGDGGQNLIGDEQGIELGLIRTQELLSARRIDGAEQFFSRAYDFGFCKTADEAMQTWGHDKILADVVWVIRTFKPDVIITRFPGDERAGHGHHAASSLLANEAFKAAADPNMFPEQFQYGTQPWQAKRILWNTFNFGGNNTIDSTQFKVDVGVYNTMLGKSYGEIASESRSQHKSQGFGVPRQRGQFFEFFTTTGGSKPVNDLMDGVDVSWSRIEQNNATDKRIDAIIKAYDFEHPEKSVDSLIALYKYLLKGGKGFAAIAAGDSLPVLKKNKNGKTLILRNTSVIKTIAEAPVMEASGIIPAAEQIELAERSYWYSRKKEEIIQTILNMSGIFAEAVADNEFAVQGDSVRIRFNINRRNNVPVNLTGIRLNNFDTVISNNLVPNQNLSFIKSFFVNGNEPVSQPFWLEQGLSGGSFQINRQQDIGKNDNDAVYNASFIFEMNGNKFSVQKPVLYKYTDPVKGELYQPVRVIAPLAVSFSPGLLFANIQPGNNYTKNPVMQLHFHSEFAASQIPVTIHINQGKKELLSKDTIINFEKGKTYNIDFSLKQITNAASTGNVTAEVLLNINGQQKTYTQHLKSIQYDHIPNIHYLYKDKTITVTDEIKTGKNNIAYITGAGDRVATTLQLMGYQVTLLNENDITDEKLKQFDAVISGIRAYNVHNWLAEKYDILMNYVQQGGNYIVQYNTNNFVSTVSSKIGPYAFNIGRNRITDEKAQVHILEPAHSALNYPNKITEKDFDNWVQERSIYQADKPDEHYKNIFSMHDGNEKETTGSLIITPYGKGNFVYTGLVFFRELPAGIAGACRLMANLIALPQNK